MDTRNFIGAGLRDAKIRLSDGTLVDIYAVVNSEGTPQREDTEVRGDDQLLGTFNSSLREELSVQANGISFDVLQAITGNTAASSATGSSIPLGTDSELNAPFVELQAFTAAKSKDGSTAYLKKTWYKVQFTSVQVSQAGEQEFNATLEGVALQTEVDIEGDPLPERAIAILEAIQGDIPS